MRLFKHVGYVNGFVQWMWLLMLFLNFTISIPTTAHPLDTKRNLTVARLLEY